MKYEVWPFVAGWAQGRHMAKETVIVAVVNSKGDRFLRGKTLSASTILKRSSTPLCTTDANLSGESSKFWLMQKLVHQDRGSEGETVRHQGTETEQIIKLLIRH